MEINEKRVNQQVRNFEKALNSYNYNEPLSRYLTRFFKENKQMGSSDRRMTSRFCYNYFRLGNSYSNLSILERLVFAEYLCETESALLRLYKPELADTLSCTVEQKVNHLSASYGFVLAEVFPFVDRISSSVNLNQFLLSQFVQPNLYIRLRDGNEEKVKAVFDKNEICYAAISDRTLLLANGTNLQKASAIEGLYEVQDLASQKTIDFVQAKSGQNWWDACAASGGKSLMLLDRFPKIKLLVSDVRLSILRNLDERFEKAGISGHYRKKVLDLSQSVFSIMKGEEFDGIILDAPCSGSGTWGRTPEMIQQFSLEKLTSFTNLQKKIAMNVLPYLKKGGSLVYITCSIYKDENEDVVSYLMENFGLELVQKRIIDGYTNKADSMFAAHFIKI